MSATIRYEPHEAAGYVAKISVAADGSETVERIPYAHPPSLVRKAGNFAAAATSHVLGGMREATDNQTDGRYSICCGCELYQAADNHGHCQHSKCGCVVAPAEYEGRNKLRWAEQVCPLGHWGAV